jgi:hypothetical protein
VIIHIFRSAVKQTKESMANTGKLAVRKGGQSQSSSDESISGVKTTNSVLLLFMAKKQAVGLLLQIVGHVISPRRWYYYLKDNLVDIVVRVTCIACLILATQCVAVSPL